MMVSHAPIPLASSARPPALSMGAVCMGWQPLNYLLVKDKIAVGAGDERNMGGSFRWGGHGMRKTVGSAGKSTPSPLPPPLLTEVPILSNITVLRQQQWSPEVRDQMFPYLVEGSMTALHHHRV